MSDMSNVDMGHSTFDIYRKGRAMVSFTASGPIQTFSGALVSLCFSAAAFQIILDVYQEFASNAPSQFEVLIAVCGEDSILVFDAIQSGLKYTFAVAGSTDQV